MNNPLEEQESIAKQRSRYDDFEGKILEIEKQKEKIRKMQINAYQLNKLTDEGVRIRNLHYGMHNDSESCSFGDGVTRVEGAGFSKLDRYFAEMGDPLCLAYCQLCDSYTHDSPIELYRVIGQIKPIIDKLAKRQLTLHEYLSAIGEVKTAFNFFEGRSKND